MRCFTSISVLLSSLSLLSTLAAAQSSAMNPGCSTISSILHSCLSKSPGFTTLGAAATFSCICYDSASNYVPTVYDNAAQTCTQFLSSAFSVTNNFFELPTPGVCADPAFVPTTTAAAPSSTALVNSTTSSVSCPQCPTATPTLNLAAGYFSNSTASITAKPSYPSASGAAGAATTAPVALVNSTAKGEGSKLAFAGHDGLILSIFGTIVAAVLVL